jgi:methionyl-tRNA formyltransferase
LKPLSIIFAGTPEFSVPALNSLVAAGHRIVAVYTQPDRPAGRGQQVSMSAVKQAALERPTAIEAHETSGTLHDRLAAIGAQAVVDAIEGLTNGDIEPRPQPEDGATYAAKIRKEEAVVDWRKSAVELDRQVRAFNPWPVAQTQWEGQQLRIWQANALGKNSTNAPGTVLHGDSSGIQVATGEGVLNVTRVQLAGRKAVSAAEFLNAHRIGGAVLT